jgi:hypothetical protein
VSNLFNDVSRPVARKESLLFFPLRCEWLCFTATPFFSLLIAVFAGADLNLHDLCRHKHDLRALDNHCYDLRSWCRIYGLTKLAERVVTLRAYISRSNETDDGRLASMMAAYRAMQSEYRKSEMVLKRFYEMDEEQQRY